VRGIFPVGDDVKIVVKGVAYSIEDLLAGSRYSEAFAGGQFIHAYQAVTDYHHFHLPFAGKILEKENVAGYVWLDLERRSLPRSVSAIFRAKRSVGAWMVVGDEAGNFGPVWRTGWSAVPWTS